MRRSTDRILVSHAGTMPPPDGWRELIADRAREDELRKRLPDEVNRIVREQVETGIDIVNDGEYNKRGGFNGYIRERLVGIEQRPFAAGEKPTHVGVNGRDELEFPAYHASGKGGFPGGGFGAAASSDPFFCNGPLAFVGAEAVKEDAARLKDAVGDLDAQPFISAISPGTIEHWLWNAYYPDSESFLFAIADALHDEYSAIVAEGVVLQIDDPDLPDAWQMYPDMSIADYRKYAELRMEALNHALRDVPQDMVRHHICWGSQHGPHKNDIPLEHIVDIVLKSHSECLSIEAANPVHEDEWTVWESVKLPDGKTIMPGCVGHVTDLIERPNLVAQRLVRYANLVGKENVVAGTDCGIGSRVGNGEIAWAKLASLAEGARIASEQLWG
jgi:5-methyltetrahydropteroyltriglutamate--homocysteine methyltransferase